MNLAQEFYLCVLDGNAFHGNKLPTGIGGALLVELQLRGRVEVGKEVELVDLSPVGDPMLDDVLASWREAEPTQRKTTHVVSGLGQGQHRRVIEQTVADGLAVTHPGEKRRLFPGHKAPYNLPTEAGEEPRRRARELLLGQRAPDVRTALLVTLLDACGFYDGVVTKAERREAKQRVRALGESDGVPEAVKKAISQVQASIGDQMTPNV
jgi:hypothetical protein